MKDTEAFLGGIWPPGERVQRYLVCIGALALLWECFNYVVVPAATGYETSPITQYPVFHWVSFAIVLTTGIVVLVGDAARKTGYWPYSLALVLANYGLFYFLPQFRGYALYGRGTADVLYHLGYAKGISQLGRLPVVGDEITWYPMTHMIVAELDLFGISLPVAKYLFSFVTIVLVIIGAGLALYLLLEDRTAALLGFAVAIPLLLAGKHVAMQPQFVSISVFPLIVATLELYRRTESGGMLVVLLLLLGSTVYFHPVTMGYMFALMLLSVGFWRVYEVWTQRKTRQLRVWVALVFVPLGFIWYIDFDRTSGNVTTLVESLQRGASAAGAEATQATESVLTAAQIGIRFIQLYGALMLYLLVAGVVGCVVLWRIYERQPVAGEAYVATHAGFGVIASGTFLVGSVIAQGPHRIFRYLAVFAILSVGVALFWTVVSKHRFSNFASLGLTIMIVTAGIVGAGAVYVPNNHLTHAEYDGTEFVLEAHDEDGASLRSYDASIKMEMYVIGAGAGPRPYQMGGGPEHTVYHQLGYDDNETAAKTYGDSYVITQAHDRQQHRAKYYFPAQRRALFAYNESHLRVMRDDPSAQKYYDNGGYEAWKVRNSTASDGEDGMG